MLREYPRSPPRVGFNWNVEQDSRFNWNTHADREMIFSWINNLDECREMPVQQEHSKHYRARKRTLSPFGMDCVMGVNLPGIETTRREHLAALAGFASAIAIGAPDARAAENGIGHVEQMRGRASAELAGISRALDRRAQVFVGDNIITEENARLLLRLGRSTVVRLGERARLHIDRFLADTGGVLDLMAGAVQFEHTGPRLQDELQLRSLYGLIAVRGTRFYAAPTEKGFSVLVGSGSVDVTAGGRTVRVGPQQGTDIPAQGQPPTPPAAWRLPRIRRMQAMFS
jgi:hypothetical protein